MQKKRVLILGGGISGLSAAWYLGRSSLPLEIAIVEKTDRVGGWMDTDQTTGFHFEKGPRSFKVDRSPALIQLIKELGLQAEIHCSSPEASDRYIWSDQKLHRLPRHPLSLFFSPITKGVIPALLSEWRKPAKKGDESVWEFVARRFNGDVARLLFDPMVVGIFGGDPRQISIKACFPKLKEWEEQAGSVTKGFFQTAREKKKRSPFSAEIPDLPLSALFSLRGGMEMLTQSLLYQIPAQIHYGQEVKAIDYEGGEVKVTTDRGIFFADILLCALPVHVTGALLEKFIPSVSKELSQVPCVGLTVVNCGYDAKVLNQEGFGYLIPSSEREDVLGCIFDSSLFPKNNRREEETRLTILLKETGKEEAFYRQAAQEGIRRQLGVSALPKEISFKRAAEAIPQYRVGHLEKMHAVRQLCREKMPWCHLVGNYLIGVSVDHCIQLAKEVALECSVSMH